MGDFYCGLFPKNKNQERGSAEYCANAKQIRYYGIKAINKDLAKRLTDTNSRGRINPEKEKLKLRRLQDQAKMLKKEVQEIQLILESDTATKTQINAAKKKKAALPAKRDKLVKQLREQQQVIRVLEAEEKRMDKERAKEKAKAKKKTSGSKTTSKTKKSSGKRK